MSAGPGFLYCLNTNCRKTMPIDAARCPSCGSDEAVKQYRARHSAAPPTPAPAIISQPPPVGKKSLSPWTVGIVAVLGIGWLLGSVFDFGGTKYEAQAEARRLVKERLLSPSSAEFSEEYVVERPNKAYTLWGIVEAQNGFGVKLQKKYVCQLRYEGRDGWTVEDVELKDP